MCWPSGWVFTGVSLSLRKPLAVSTEAARGVFRPALPLLLGAGQVTPTWVTLSAVRPVSFREWEVTLTLLSVSLTGKYKDPRR